jgi:hypothetical protein
MNQPNEWLKTIYVGHREGEKDLHDPARKSYFQQKMWKWRYPNTPGETVPSRWFKGDEFVRLMRNLGLGRTA